MIRSFVVLCVSLLPMAGIFPVSLTADNRVPFPIDWSRLDQSCVDLSRYLDAPAGKHGFIRAQGEHFVDDRGKRVRFWGVNLVGPSCFPSHQKAETFAATLARLGINCVRFHGLDSNWGRSSIDRSSGDTSRLDEENLERFDYFFDQLKRRGIYANLNLNTFRTYGPADGLPDHEVLGLGKWATHFHPRVIELEQKYARDLLSHVNPYTGLAYTEDPAVLVVEIVNENSLIEGWFNWKLVGENDNSRDTWSPIPVAYAGELNRQFNDWLNKHRTAEQLASFRDQAGLSGDAPLTLLAPDQFASASQERFAADYEFIVGTEKQFLLRMKRLIKGEIGLKSMLIGDADHNDSINGYPHIASSAVFDYIDGHGYWQHPSIGRVTRTKNDPMVNDPSDSTVVQFARTPMAGMPYMISETNHPYPHAYACEGIPILAAYAMFQDWDGVVFHEWGGGVLDQATDSIPSHGWFRLSHDPLKMAELMVAGLMWHRRDVDAAQKVVTRSMTAGQMLASAKDRDNFWKLRPFFDPHYSRLLPLVHRTRWTLGQTPHHAEYPESPALGNIVSDTGQLRWHDADHRRGRVVIDTPKVQGLIGFHRDLSGRSYPGVTHMSVDIKNDFAALVLISLDQQPIVQSKKLLLLAADRSANQDLTWQDDFQTVATWGSGSVCIRPVDGRISLWGLPQDADLHATALGPLGEPTGETWPTRWDQNGWHIQSGNPAALMALIERQ